MADELIAPPPTTGRAVAWLLRAVLVVAGAMLGLLLIATA